MKTRLLCPLVLAMLAGATSALAERHGVMDWAESDSGEYECLHCKLAAMRLAEEEGADGLRFDAASGRDLRNYPPNRPADLKHMKLEMDIPDMNRPELSAKQTLTLSPIAQPLDVLTLNAEQMEVSSVEIPDSAPAAATTKVSHSYDGKKLAIRFDPPLPPDVEAQVVVKYTLSDPVDGMTWTPEAPEWPGRPAQMHTQGQPETNRYWFPAHDFPNERLTTEIIATVPEGFIVSANGREAEKASTSGGRTRFHWLQDKEHVSYLVSMVVGKFDVKDVAPASDKLRMPVYVPPGKGETIERTYKRTPDMIKVFEERFSEPYAWDRYAQLSVWNFGAGGMENTSATTMYDTAYLEEKALADEDLDGLISHELGHQWFGDLITCNTWAHIWLNEGWATYCSALWFEARDGAQNGYMNSMWRTMRNIARTDQLAPDASDKDKARPGMVSPIYKDPFETFRRTSNPYPKGCSMLHMLRRELGDELFFKCVGAYVDRYKLRTAETADFRRTFEEVSGRSLEHFFDQWAMRPGTPKVSVKASWKEKDKELKLVVEQKQLIDMERPAYVFELPIEVFVAPHANGDPAASAASEPTRLTISVDSKRHEQTIKLGAEPSMVLADPDLHVLMDVEVDAPTDWLVAQLTTGRSIASRLDAMQFVRGKGNEKVREALVRVVHDGNEWHTVRSEAAEALGKLSALDELVSLLGGGVENARVRRACINALAEVGGEKSVAVLAKHAADQNESYACRAAALEGLGKRAARGSAEYLPVFAAALEAPSQHDQVRIGAIRGLESLDTKDGLAMVIPYTKLGTPGRTRPDAIDTVSKLAKHDKDVAFDALDELPFDREERASRAAITALGDLKDERGLPVLERYISTTSHERFRESAQTARDKLAAALKKTESIDAAQAEIERLKTDVKRLEKQIEEK